MTSDYMNLNYMSIQVMGAERGQVQHTLHLLGPAQRPPTEPGSMSPRHCVCEQALGSPRSPVPMSAAQRLLI